MTSSFVTKVALGTVGATVGGYALWDRVVRRRWGRDGACLVDIVSADLCQGANHQFDRFTKPDCKVTCLHGGKKRCTPTENNNYHPQWLFRSKMPYYTAEGFTFTVWDDDPINGDDVIGRCHVDPAQVREIMMQSQTSSEQQSPLLLSLGDGIGVLKVRIQKAPVDEDAT